MKKWLLTVIAAMLLHCLSAQTDSLPPYKRFPTVPPLSLIQIDSSTLTKDNLKHHQATIIMYFSPSCEHCQHQWEDMVKHMKALKKYQIVMVTYQPFEEMVAFYKNYQVAKYPNIKMGRDAKFVLPPFFKIQSLPFMALYDKKWNLVTTFEGNVKIDKLLGAFGAKED